MMAKLIFFIIAAILILQGNLVQALDISSVISSQHLHLQKNQESWLSNYDEALDLAHKSKKMLLIAFVGAGWCPWSEKLQEEILSSEVFLSALKEDFVFLKIEFPENFSQFSRQNLSCVKLKEKYQIQECPLLVIVNDTDTVIAKISYLPLSSKEFATYLRETVFDFRLVEFASNPSHLKTMSFEDLKSLYQKAKRLSNARYEQVILDAGLKNDQGAFFLFEKYAHLLMQEKFKNEQVQQLRKKILDRDPQNQHGSHLKLALLDFKSFSNIPKKQKKIDHVIRPLMDYIQNFGKQDHENIWKVEMMIAEYLFSRNKIQEALEHANASFSSAPETAKQEIAESIKYLQEHIQQNLK